MSRPNERQTKTVKPNVIKTSLGVFLGKLGRARGELEQTDKPISNNELRMAQLKAFDERIKNRAQLININWIITPDRTQLRAYIEFIGLWNLLISALERSGSRAIWTRRAM